MQAQCAITDIGIVSKENLTIAPLTRCLAAEIMLADAAVRWTKEGTLDTIFYAGIESIEWMIHYFLQPENTTLACIRGANEFCGLGWVMNRKRVGNYSRAECGMGFFRHQSDKTQNLEFGQMMLDWVFQRLDVDVLYGTTPEHNKLALRFSKKLGFNLHGPIPGFGEWRGELCSAWISSMKKEDWLVRSRQIAA